jgi:small subunit ribosomal protein S12
MVTYSQYINNHRRTKKFRSSTPHFEGSPFKLGTCVKIGIVKPKKPNSAQRKITKVCLTNGRHLIAYIPGFGHKLMKNNEVMIRGGRVPDLPGVRYHLLRMKKDFNSAEIISRSHRRSKFGLKETKTQGDRLRRKLAKVDKKKEKLKEKEKKKPILFAEKYAKVLLTRYEIIKKRW